MITWIRIPSQGFSALHWVGKVDDKDRFTIFQRRRGSRTHKTVTYTLHPGCTEHDTFHLAKQRAHAVISGSPQQPGGLGQ